MQGKLAVLYNHNGAEHRNLEVILYTIVLEFVAIKEGKQPRIDFDLLPSLREAVTAFKDLNPEDPLRLIYTPGELDAALKGIEHYFSPPTEEAVRY